MQFVFNTAYLQMCAALIEQSYLYKQKDEWYSVSTEYHSGGKTWLLWSLSRLDISIHKLRGINEEYTDNTWFTEIVWAIRIKEED